MTINEFEDQNQYCIMHSERRDVWNFVINNLSLKLRFWWLEQNLQTVYHVISTRYISYFSFDQVRSVSILVSPERDLKLLVPILWLAAIPTVF